MRAAPGRAWLDRVCGPAPLVPGMWWFGRAHRATILAALEEAANSRRYDHGQCADCDLRDGRPCRDQRINAGIAEKYGDLHARLSRR